MRYTIADSSLFNLPDDKANNYRGLNVFTLSELLSVTGTTKSGDSITGNIQAPVFTLSADERVSIMQSCSYVQAVVGSRMNRISSLEWDIIPKSQIEDEIYYKMKHFKEIFDERDQNNIKDLLLRHKIRVNLQKEIPDLKDDLSNFDAAVRRWKKRIKLSHTGKIEEIKHWIAEPNLEDEFDDFIKKWVEALMVHGAVSIYKEWINDKIDNFYVLPGGTVYPLRSQKVGDYVAYAQVVTGYFPKIYFQDEVCFTNYLPSAARSYGYVPLDALINKVAEQLLFDQLAAERADGSKEPEKLIAFGENNTLFGTDLTSEINLPLDKDEQKRIETKVNTVRKGAIAVISGIGSAVVHDISKADTFQAQSQRQDKLLRDIALVFNMTNMEINLAGGEFTSGKETSETQSEIEEGKGTRPIIKKLESIINKNIIPFRFGTDYIFQYKKSKTEEEQVQLEAQRMQSGVWTKNEIRIESGRDPLLAEGNDELQQQGQQQPDGSQMNPINMRQI